MKEMKLTLRSDATASLYFYSIFMGWVGCGDFSERWLFEKTCNTVVAGLIEIFRFSGHLSSCVKLL